MVKCTIHSPPRQCLTRDREMESKGSGVFVLGPGVNRFLKPLRVDRAGKLIAVFWSLHTSITARCAIASQETKNCESLRAQGCRLFCFSLRGGLVYSLIRADSCSLQGWG
jgi:hypothetical protein